MLCLALVLVLQVSHSNFMHGLRSDADFLCNTVCTVVSAVESRTEEAGSERYSILLHFCTF